jgi:hypothetical protein
MTARTDHARLEAEEEEEAEEDEEEEEEDEEEEEEDGIQCRSSACLNEL